MSQGIRLNKLHKGTPLCIHWVDSMHTAGWIKESAFNMKDKELEHITIGMYLKHTKKSVSCFQSCGCTKSEDKNIDAIMSIPRCAITSIQVLK